jgi:uncharacterized protein YjdB
METRPVRFLCLLAAVLISASGCAPGSRIPVLGVKLTPQTLVFAGIGEAQALTATVVPENATDQAVFWESTDPSIASVDALGRVTARAIGSNVFVTVRTDDGNFQASCNVQVSP